MARPDAHYYEQVPAQLILRDYLATDRTALANERTLLAYIRTALTLLVAGISFIQFFRSPVVWALGWGVIAIAAATAGVGAVRFSRLRRSLREVVQGEDPLPLPHEPQ